jgi:hypothetical protein
MDEVLSPETVLADLKHSAIWGGRDDDGLANLAHHALFFAGRGHPEINPLLAAFYPEYANRIPEERRWRIFARIRSLVYERVLRSDVVIHFLCHDPDLEIVSAAARDAALLGLAEEPGGARGADWVLKLVVTGSVQNSGAALGGLLSLGDEAVIGKLVTLRAGLALPWADRALGQMASAATGDVFATTVEFWLDWMETLAPDLPESARVFDWVAHALVQLREAMLEQTILRGRSPTRASATGGQNGVPGAGEVTLADFAKTLGPRLRALAPRVRHSEHFARALAAWLGSHEPDAPTRLACDAS